MLKEKDSLVSLTRTDAVHLQDSLVQTLCLYCDFRSEIDDRTKNKRIVLNKDLLSTWTPSSTRIIFEIEVFLNENFPVCFPWTFIYMNIRIKH